MTLIDPDLVERFTGQRRVTSIEQASAELNAASDALERATLEQKSVRKRWWKTVVQSKLARLHFEFAKLPAKFKIEPWIVALVAGLVLGLLGGLIWIVLPHVSVIPAILSATLTPLVFLAAIRTLCPPDVEPLRKVVSIRQTAEAGMTAEYTASKRSFKEANDRQLLAQKISDGIQQAADFPRSRLINADIRAMTGTDFEHYLGEVFTFLGYEVRHTGMSGDQGVDLIVSRGNGYIAVQAKCYGGSVGNSAVQQAFAGMTFYQCQRSAVITSSTFTPSARSIAEATGTILIDGSQIADLIRGTIAL